MVEDTAEKAPPTVQELETKVQRLTNQVVEDQKAAASANDAFARAVKSGNVDQALDLADKRTATKATVAKSEAQLKSAQSAVASAKRAANAGAIADLSQKRRSTFDALPGLNDGPVTVPCSGPALALIEAIAKMGSVLAEYAALEVTTLKIERSEETGKLLVNPLGPSVKRAKSSNGGGNRGTASWEVEGKSYTSRELLDAHKDMLTDKVREHYNSGNFRAFSMTREAERIHGLLTS